ncbi:MAG: hypothetical protein AAGD32_13730 [Planctomycetota bacterium]
MTVPEEIRHSLRFDPENDHATASGPNDSEENTMPETATPAAKPLDEQAVAALVAETVEKMDSDKAIANQVHALTTDKLTAEQATAAATEELEKIKGDKAEADQKVTDLTAELDTAKASLETAEKAKTELQEQLDAAKAELNKHEVDKAVASRKGQLAELDKAVATDEQVAKLTAVDKDGKFQLSEDAFDIALAALKTASDAIADKAEASQDTTETPEGETPEGAGDDTTETPDQATATQKGGGDETPDEPDLAGVDQYHQAMATLIGTGQVPSTNAALTSKFAQLGTSTS